MFRCRFPKDENLRKIWIEVLGIDNYCRDWQRVCSDHFLVENFGPGTERPKLLQNSIPQPYYQEGFPNK